MTSSETTKNERDEGLIVLDVTRKGQVVFCPPDWLRITAEDLFIDDGTSEPRIVLLISEHDHNDEDT